MYHAGMQTRRNFYLRFNPTNDLIKIARNFILSSENGSCYLVQS
jgi:hypothetical protein